jgi:hypothetical protein
VAQLQVNCALRCEHACETYAYPRDSHGFPSSLHMHLSHLPSLLGVFRPLLLSLAVRADPASRCWELQVHFWATWIRPAAGSGRKGIGRVRRLIYGGLRATETSRAHQSLCVHTCQRCVHTVRCILSCGGMCKEARTHDRRVWAGWLRACQLAHFRCARGP